MVIEEGAGEMVKWLRVRAALQEILSSILSIQNHLYFQVQEVQSPLLAAKGTRHACGTQAGIQAEHLYT